MAFALGFDGQPDGLDFFREGGCLGTLLAVWGVKALVTLGPQNLPRLAGVTVDGWSVGLAGGRLKCY